MNDIYFIAAGCITILVVCVIHAILQHCGECNHRWSKWQDPVEKEGWLWQFRVCEKCNMQEVRKIQ